MASSQHPAAAARTAALLSSLWKRNLPTLRERMIQLDVAADLAAKELLTPAVREEAAATAHKLAGSLGMFGYPEGTRLARDLENLLSQPDPSAAQLLHLTQELRAALKL